MQNNLTLALVEFGLQQFLVVLTIIGVLATAAGFAYYSFRVQKNRVRDDKTRAKADAAAEWRGVADAHAAKIEDLQGQVQTWKLAHEQCEKKINVITQFNLRLQARERGYQRTINRLEIRAGIEPTDFNDITDAPSFDT